MTYAIYPELHAFVEGLESELGQISVARRSVLESLSAFVETKLRASEPARLIFICTHNSRRSHMGQIWSKAASLYCGIQKLETFSGGTEATAFDPRAVAALRKAGLRIERRHGKATSNPVYAVRYGARGPAEEAFSKAFHEAPNPRHDFAAVMTCSEAEAACPIVPGAALRISLPYDDPKTFDGTDRESSAYAERSCQIAREMLFVFSRSYRR